MQGWDWLIKPQNGTTNPYTRRFITRVLIKAVVLFLVINTAFLYFDWGRRLDRTTISGTITPTRERLPYAENQTESYSLSPDDLEATFRTHRLTWLATQPKYEKRVIVIGDSSVWGVLLNNNDTLAGQLNALKIRDTRFYNLGYPVQSLTKDALILNYAVERFQPDLILWLVTLESFAPESQLAPMLVRRNPAAVERLVRQYGLKIDPNNSKFMPRTLWENTLIGGRRRIADWLRLELYGFTGGATGVDQVYPRFYIPRMEDFDPDDFTDGLDSWAGLTSDLTGNLALPPDFMAFHALEAGLKAARSIPVILVNEPMFISSGQNSDVRYNFFYPRWAYDRYREQLRTFAERQPNLTYLDLWDAIPPSEFTDSAVHLTPTGSRQLTELIYRQALQSTP